MEKKKSLISIFTIVIFTHIYLFASLKIEEKKVIAPKATNSNVQINLSTVIIKKQEVTQVEKEVVRKKIEKKVFPKTESKNIIKEIKKEKLVKKKIHKKIHKKEFKEKIVEQNVRQIIKEVNKEINPDKLKAIENEYLLKLKKLIEKNKIYPNSAKRLNQTGKVFLNFTISKDGRIVDVRIIENSKYKRLDDAALEIITKIKSFEPIPNELNKNSWNITVPVLYQIIRS